MMSKLKGANGDVKEDFGTKLWRNAKLVKKVLLQYVAALPGAKNFNALPSGQGLHEVLKKGVLQKYKEVQAAQAKKKCADGAVPVTDWDGDYSDIPATWWLDNATCSYFLAVMVHRGTSIISMTAANAPPGEPRIVLRSANQAVRAVESEKHKAAAVVTAPPDPLDYEYKKAKVEGFKSMVVKAKADALHTRMSASQLHMQMLRDAKDEFPHSDEYQTELSIVRGLPKNYGDLEKETTGLVRRNAPVEEIEEIAETPGRGRGAEY